MKIIHIPFILIFLSCNKPAETFTVSLSSNPIGAGNTIGEGLYSEGSTVTVTAEPNSGYTFINWIDVSNGKTLSSDKEYSFSILSKTTLSAIFTKNVKSIIIAEQENFGIQVIPNYGTNVSQDTLHVLTRYIGEIFLTQGISVTQSGAISQSGETDMVISTKDLENRQLYNSIVGGGPHIWIAKSFSSTIYPWAKPDNNLVFQMYAAVPIVNLTDPKGNTAHSGFSANQAPVTQLSFGFYLLDESTGKTFAYIICAYESRGSYTETAKSNDTFVNFASSPVEESSLYITKSSLSAPLQSMPYVERKFFKVHISSRNLLKAIRDANHGLSEDLSKYRITFAGAMLELPNYVLNGHNTSRVNVSKFSVFIE